MPGTFLWVMLLGLGAQGSIGHTVHVTGDWRVDGERVVPRWPHALRHGSVITHTGRRGERSDSLVIRIGGRLHTLACDSGCPPFRVDFPNGSLQSSPTVARARDGRSGSLDRNRLRSLASLSGDLKVSDGILPMSGGAVDLSHLVAQAEARGIIALLCRLDDRRCRPEVPGAPICHLGERACSVRVLREGTYLVALYRMTRDAAGTGYETLDVPPAVARVASGDRLVAIQRDWQAIAVEAARWIDPPVEGEVSDLRRALLLGGM